MENSNEDTSHLLSVAVRSTLEQLIAAKFPERKFSYVTQKATEKGDNYIGVVYRISVRADALETKQEGQSLFHLILKVPPDNVTQRKQFFARPCFLRESVAYDEFLPLLKEFQSSKTGVQLKHGFYEYPICYQTITEELSEAIFMEDLRVEQFELFDRFQQLDFQHAALIMRAYGKLHAVSFALKHEQPHKLQRIQCLKDIFEQRKDDVQFASYFEELKKSTMESLDTNRHDKYIDALKRYYEKGSFFDLLLELIDPCNCEPFAVVCHGDCWINNFLFKKEDGAPIEVRLIDWQLMRYSTPISDLMYFIFTCTTRQFRQLYYQKLMNIYYQELKDHAERLDCNAEQLFPRAAFEDQLQRKGAIGLLMAMIVLPIITMKAEDTPDLAELSKRIEAGDMTDLKGAGMLAESNVAAYQQRMRDTVMDCIDYGYI